ncbi:transcriptional regulator, tetR family protein [Lentisphaera araneosa HTCC2155]|uniref:Transcriptional regulator, tetR family protein n=1 Tax=Lentisphaera araneosa HTCC2155 TaxID=313628 RepID=A6DRA5_9BACT|nr:TetR/AcrR family transcriptional regulator [Lentisphaera araneosa]EDM25852.1 transcriptional regulator, tetR family protein [Lentisphaera araneosa HTCC2155]
MDKREKILEAASKNFKDRGFASTTISKIAKDANIGKGTIYEYFNSKEELLMYCCIENCQAVEASLDSLVEAFEESNNNPVKIIYTTIHTVLSEFFKKGVEENRLFYELSLLIATNPQIKTIVSQEFQLKVAHWQSLALADYQKGLEQGYFRDIDNPEDLACFIVATIDGLIWQMQWANEDELLTRPERMANMYLNLILKEPHRLEEFIK